MIDPSTDDRPSTNTAIASEPPYVWYAAPVVYGDMGAFARVNVPPGSRLYGWVRAKYVVRLEPKT